MAYSKKSAVKSAVKKAKKKDGMGGPGDLMATLGNVVPQAAQNAMNRMTTLGQNMAQGVPAMAQKITGQVNSGLANLPGVSTLLSTGLPKMPAMPAIPAMPAMPNAGDMVKNVVNKVTSNDPNAKITNSATVNSNVSNSMNTGGNRVGTGGMDKPMPNRPMPDMSSMRQNIMGKLRSRMGRRNPKLPKMPTQGIMAPKNPVPGDTNTY